MAEVEDFIAKMEVAMGLKGGDVTVTHSFSPSSEKMDILQCWEVRQLAKEMISRQSKYGNKKSVEKQVKQAGSAIMQNYVKKAAESVEALNLSDLYEELSKYVRVLCVLAAKPKADTKEEKAEFAKRWTAESAKAKSLETYKRKLAWCEYFATSVGKTPKGRWIVPNLIESTKAGADSKKISGNFSLSAMASAGLKDQAHAVTLKKYNAAVMFNSLQEPFMDLHAVCVQ